MKPRSVSFYIAAIIAALALLWGGAAESFLSKNGVTPYAPVPGDPYPDYLTTPNWAYSPPLRKFKDTLPQLTAAGANNLGQYIPVAVPDIVTYPGSDYYIIELRQFSEKMHRDLPPTTLRGYVQVNNGTAAGCADPSVDSNDPNNCTMLNNSVAPSPIHYLGPLIIAKKDRPVRVLFKNKINPGVDGDLFLPVDGTIMGSGPYEINYDPVTKSGTVTRSGNFSTNRATLHLHGGRNPWISDGTPHQWIAPAGDDPVYPQGVSVSNVPDMPLPLRDSGEQTFYWTNQQSARMMFFHDHSWGLTRLNVYAGEAAGYIIKDAVEDALINGGTVGGRTFSAGTIPADQIPLVIQDKTFVDANTIISTDPTWNWGVTPGTPNTGDLWWPHVYMPAQNPFDVSGIAPLGRWAYGPYFWPATNNPYQPVDNPYYNPSCDPTMDPTPLTLLDAADIAWNETNVSGYTTINGAPFCQTPQIPSTPNPSWGAEAFMDTMTVNGTAFPVLNIQPKPYRLRILNAAHDRFLNLSFFLADAAVNANTVVADDPTTPMDEAALTTASAALCANPVFPGGCAANTEVRMLPAVDYSADPTWPATWPADVRPGGIPDWNRKGPDWIMIGNEGGFLPQPVIIPPHPVNWNVDVTTFNAGNVNAGSLILGPAERADVIVDFSAMGGKTLILYNDAPAPWPAIDPHYDYYTGSPDNTDMGGYTEVIPGFGPNIRTVMQINVSAGAGPGYNTAPLFSAFTSTSNHAGPKSVFQIGQDPIIVGQGNMNPASDPAYYEAFPFDTAPYAKDYSAYNKAYDYIFPSIYPNWGISQINSKTLNFSGFDAAGNLDTSKTYTTATVPHPLDPTVQVHGGVPIMFKAIQDEQGETFDDFGRMRAALGIENITPVTGRVNFSLQTNSDPPTEILNPGEIQIWKITHNGVDTHPVHFHLFDVQVINRVGWDGFVRLPDPTELGWKETVRISPLEDTIVALRPVKPALPFSVPDSNRPKNPARPVGALERVELTQTDPITGAARDNHNEFINFGWEYVWHCHILSHEENDMMRPMVLNVVTLPPVSPILLGALGFAGSPVNLSWLDGTPVPASLGNPANEMGFRIERAIGAGAFVTIGSAPANATAFTDNTTSAGTVYLYRVVAYNSAGEAVSNAVGITAPPVPPIAPSGLSGQLLGAPLRVSLTWVDNSNNEAGFVVERSANGGAFVAIAGPGANVTAYTDNTVAPGNTYSYRVMAINATGPSAYSNTVAIVVPLPPAAPSGLTGQQLSNPLRVNLTWVDNSNSETGFVVERSVNGGAFTTIATPGANVVSYSNTAVSVGNTYTYRVKAVNISGASAYSNTFQILVTLSPAAPTNVVVSAVRSSATRDTVTLRWIDNATNETSYTVQRATNAAFTTNLSTTTLGANRIQFVQNTNRGVTYYYRVRARNGSGTSAWVNAIPFPITTP